jgi:condensin complex subunit 2
LQLKKFELEFAVDPLFKKASADFDEGGAKGLLLNHLSIDAQGRIVFDSSDDVNEATASADKDSMGLITIDTEEPPSPSPQPRKEASVAGEGDMEIDLGPLANKFFPDLDRLTGKDICPSLKNFDLGDPSGALDIPLLKAPEEWRHDKSNESDGENEHAPIRDASGIILDDDNAVGFDDDDGTFAGFAIGEDAGFGEGGEAWARDAALEPMLKVHRMDLEGQGHDGEGEFDNNDAFAVSLSHTLAHKEHENVLSYFDNALQKNWAGPEHWRIRRIKENVAASSTNAAPRQRKEREPFEIDFVAQLDPGIAELIYSQASSNSTISLPKTQWKTKDRNLLPDDKHFNSRPLLRLFLKPKARMRSKQIFGPRRANGTQQQISTNGEMDEAFWASHKPDNDAAVPEDGAAPGTYDANFFADDDGLAFPNGLPLGDDDDDNLPFADAREMFSPPVDSDARPMTSAGDPNGASGITALLGAIPGSALHGGQGGFGSQLVTQGGRRVRPEYVAYARVAKKVDVRRLKEEMWKGMGDRLTASTEFSSASGAVAVTAAPAVTVEPPTPTLVNRRTSNSPESANPTERDGLRFTSVMKSLKHVYPEQALRDISTSYGFICLLHLANEKGLVLQGGDPFGNEEGALEEIYVSKDEGAVIEEGAI